jgi:L-asparaginase
MKGKKEVSILLIYTGGTIGMVHDPVTESLIQMSFMLEGLEKPVIFTGSQLPIGLLRTDGRENLITSIEIAATMEHGKPVVPEVCIYFDNKLTRGNRTTKFSAEHLNAFNSPNYPPLAGEIS